MKIKKAVIPAAGLGTRVLPASKSMPKEMLPIVDKPAIQYLVEEAVASGITDILIVTGRNKEAIENHFDHSLEYYERLEKSGKTKQLEELKKSAGDNEELTRKIGELEQQNKADKAAYEKELATIRLTAAVDAELTAAGAKNNTAVRALLADYLKDAKIEDGKVVAKVNNESITLAAKIEAMKKDANTDFLFGSTGAKLTGWKPGDPDTGRKPGEGKKPSEMSYSELAAFLAENPDAKLE